MATSLSGKTEKERSATDWPRSIGRLASLILVIGALYFGRAVLVPLALAILLTFALVPMVTRVERLRIGRPVSVILVVICGLSATCSLAWLAERELAEVVTRWPEYRANFQRKTGGFLRWVDRLEGYRVEIGQALEGESAGQNDSSAATPLPAATGAGNKPVALGPVENTPPLLVRVAPERSSLIESAALNMEEWLAPFATAFTVAVMLIFLLLDWDDLRDRMLSLLTEAENQVARDALGDAAKRVSRFLVTQSIINLCFGVLAAVGFWIIHITLGGRATAAFALTAGILCGVLRFIPYVGVWIGASLPLAFMFAAYPTNTIFLVALAMLLTMEIFTAQVIEPRFLGASAGISATAVMLSIVFWTWLWGPVGLLLSTPLTVLLVVMGKHLPRFRYLYVLLADCRELDLAAHSMAFRRDD
jgi:predicted PurR-regulated permease PerM